MVIELRKSLIGMLVCLSACGHLPAQESEPQPEQSLVLAEFDIPTDGDMMVAPVTVAGRTYQFLIDTGCYWTVFDSALQPLLGRAVESRKSENPLGPSGNSVLFLSANVFRLDARFSQQQRGMHRV